MLSFVYLALAIPAIVAASDCTAPLPYRSDVDVAQCSSSTGSAKTVDLKSASSFTVLAQTGVSVVPDMKLHGNLGVSPVSETYVTGFSYKRSGNNAFATSAQVIDGVIYAADNQASPSPQAVQDALSAFYTLGNATNPNYSELQSGSLDGGLSLYNGLYSWSTAIHLGAGQELILNGNSDDVFIFQAADTISFGQYSTITLKGNVSAENVYWISSTDLDVGANSTIAGTFMTATKQAFGVGCSIVGRSFANTQTAFAKGCEIKTAGCDAEGSC